MNNIEWKRINLLSYTSLINKKLFYSSIIMLFVEKKTHPYVNSKNRLCYYPIYYSKLNKFICAKPLIKKTIRKFPIIKAYFLREMNKHFKFQASLIFRLMLSLFQGVFYFKLIKYLLYFFNKISRLFLHDRLLRPRLKNIANYSLIDLDRS